MAAEEPWLTWQKSKVAAKQVSEPEDHEYKVRQKTLHLPGMKIHTERVKGPPTPFACPRGIEPILLPHGRSSEGMNLRARAAPYKLD